MSLNTPSLPITVVVNSTDYYSEAWDPFFKLLEVFWPNRTIPVVLNTETKSPDWLPAGATVHHNKMPGDKKMWPECLWSVLDSVESPYILYLQEDYFLNGPVSEIAMKQMVEILDSGDADVVRSAGTGLFDDYQASSHAGWVEVTRNHGYYACTQATLWRKEALRDLVVSGETAWEFERHGTKRARKQLKGVYAPDPEVFPGMDSRVFPYVATGIVKGKWFRPAVDPLFKEHGINVDFSIRGFYEPTPWEQFVQRQRSRLRRLIMR